MGAYLVGAIDGHDVGLDLGLGVLRDAVIGGRWLMKDRTTIRVKERRQILLFDPHFISVKR